MKFNLKDMILCALFAALISIGAMGSIPLPGGIPFSVQPLFAMMAGAVLGSKRGALSMTLYMLMGVVGLPVFSNGAGGPGYILTPSFGYIIGFIFCAYAVGKIVEISRANNSKTGLVIAPFVGLMIDYIIGVPYLYMIFNVVMGKAIDVNTALVYGFYPFIILDLVKAAIVVVLLFSLVPRLERQGILT